MLTGSGLALPGGNVRQAAGHELEFAESWKYQFKVVIVKTWKGCVGKEGDPRRGRLEPRVWSREEGPEGGGGAGLRGGGGGCVCARARVQGEVCEAGVGGGGGRGGRASVPGGPGGFPVVRMPRPLPGSRVWSWVGELGSYM